MNSGGAAEFPCDGAERRGWSVDEQAMKGTPIALHFLVSRGTRGGRDGGDGRGVGKRDDKDVA